MREELERKRLKGVSIIAGVAANMPLESQSVDAVIARR
jgi:ubiquinone/menaquinone biosynthesis C-methylase UbiE